MCNSNIFCDVKIEEKQQFFAETAKIINKKDFVKGSNFDHDSFHPFFKLNFSNDKLLKMKLGPTWQLGES